MELQAKSDPLDLLPAELWKRVLSTLTRILIYQPNHEDPLEAESELIGLIQVCSLFYHLIVDKVKVLLLGCHLGAYNDLPRDRQLIKQLHNFYLPKPTRAQIETYLILRLPVWTHLHANGHPKPYISIPSRIELELFRLGLSSGRSNKLLRGIYLYGSGADLDRLLKVTSTIADLNLPLSGFDLDVSYLVAVAEPRHYPLILARFIKTSYHFTIGLFTDLNRLKQWIEFLDSDSRIVLRFDSPGIQFRIMKPSQIGSTQKNELNNIYRPGRGVIGNTGPTGPSGWASTVGYPDANRRPQPVQPPWSELQAIFRTETFPEMTTGNVTVLEHSFLTCLIGLSCWRPVERWFDHNGVPQLIYRTRRSKHKQVRVSGSIEPIKWLNQLRGKADKLIIGLPSERLEQLFVDGQYEVLRRISLVNCYDYHRHSDPNEIPLMSHSEVEERVKRITTSLTISTIVHYEAILERYPSYFLNERFGKQILESSMELYKIERLKIRWFLGCIAGFMNQLPILQELISRIHLSDSQMEQLLKSAQVGQATSCYRWLQQYRSITDN